jgi:2-polyprenyl-3-methyl-5-hydroxy-6-metoxy-1,4-benzoquinol methylase
MICHTIMDQYLNLAELVASMYDQWPCIVEALDPRRESCQAASVTGCVQPRRDAWRPSGALKPVLGTCFSTMNSTHPCWCGQTELADFSPDYLFCERCQTLVVKNWPPAEQFDVVHDESDFYGRSYYESHVIQDYGLPSLGERARNDLNERCMHWMRTVLKYRLPPARTLELGCAHGGFVALMRWAGFDATGLEVSPSLVEYAKSTFGVPMLTGPIEKQNIEPGTLDMILHFDVLEHLPDPRGTMERCMELLTPDGSIILQTPCFPIGRTYEEMVRNKDRFLEQLKPAEHLHLFNRASIARLFSEVGAPFLHFEPAIFDHYDMFLVASPRELTPHSEEEATKALLRRPEGRIVQALLDANTQCKELSRRYGESEADREVRLRLLGEADVRIREIEADREARLQLLREADAQIREIEADREARLQLLREADARIREIEADREAIEQVLLKMDASYRLQMSYGLARLLRRLQAPLKMDALYKAMEERLAPATAADGSEGTE